MPKMFDRDHDDHGIYENALAEWENSTTSLQIEEKSMARNLRCDHRVSENREKVFREYFEDYEYDLEVALKAYATERVRDAEQPDFCDLPVNGCEGFNQKSTLGAVVTFHKFLTKIQNIDSMEIRSPIWGTELEDARRNGGSFHRWLDKYLKGKDPKSQDVLDFMEAFFDLVNYDLVDPLHAYRESIRIKPFWVTDWTLYEKYLTISDVSRWNQVVGVWRDQPTWQFVVAYPAEAVDYLYRPTQLDGSFYPYHFPPPRDYLKGKGGFTMDLDSFDEVLLPELIHKQIKLKKEYWINGGRLVGEAAATGCDVSFCREFHYKKFKDHQELFNPRDLYDWMQSPN